MLKLYENPSLRNGPHRKEGRERRERWRTIEHDRRATSEESGNCIQRY